MGDSLQFDLIFNEAKALASVERAAKQFTRFDATLERLTGGQVKFNHATLEYVEAGSKVVSIERVKEVAVERYRKAAERARQTTQGLTHASGAAQNVVFSLAQTVDDAQYGWRAMSNNVTFTVQSLGQLITSVRKGTSVMGALGAAFMGPTGIVLGITAAVSIIPALVRMLDETTDKARLAKEQLSGIAGELISIKNEQPAFAKQTKEELEGIARAMQTQKKALEGMLAARNAATTVMMDGRPLQREGPLTLAGPQRAFAQTRLDVMTAQIEEIAKKVNEQAARDAASLNFRLAGANVLTRFQIRLNEETARNEELQKDIAYYTGPQGQQLRGMILQNQRLEEQRDKLLTLAKVQESLFEKAAKSNRELGAELTLRRSAEGERLALIEFQNAQLEAQVEIVKRLGMEQQRQAGISSQYGDFGLPVRMGARGAGAAATSRKGGRRMQLRQSGPAPTRADFGMEDSLIQQANEEDLRNSLGESYDLALALSDVFGSTMAIQIAKSVTAVDGLTVAFRGMGDLMQTVFELTGEKSTKLFNLMKGFQIAEAVGNTYVAATKALTAGPIIGPIMAAGIIASGLAYVARIVSAKPNKSGTGGGGGGGASSMPGYYWNSGAGAAPSTVSAGRIAPNAGGFAPGGGQVVVVQADLRARVTHRELELVSEQGSKFLQAKGARPVFDPRRGRAAA
jgi:hypothetical protein